MDAHFDWYQTTVRASIDDLPAITTALLAEYDLADLVPARGQNGYTHGASVVRGSTTLCRLAWGGQPGVNITATSDNAPALHRAIVRLGMEHAPTRIDSRMDWIEDGLFDVLAKRLIAFAHAERLALTQVGDWTRGTARTLYIGSKDSPTRLVLYEKGYEQGSTQTGWVRLEARIRPKPRARDFVSQFSPIDVFTSAWLPDALDAMGYFHRLKGTAIGTVWRPSDAERARSVMLKQYGRVMRDWADDLGGWHELADEIQRRLAELAAGYANAPQSASQASQARTRIEARSGASTEDEEP